MTHSTEPGADLDLAVVWNGGMVAAGCAERGELLPARADRSSLPDFPTLPDDPTEPRGPAPSPNPVDRLRAAWRAWMRAHPPADGCCACGCGEALTGLNPNGRRRYLAGHTRISTRVLRHRCRQAGLDLRKRRDA